MRLLVLMVVVLWGAACMPVPETSPRPTRQPATESQSATSVGFSRDGLTVRLPKPAGWESFTTEYGVVIAEQFGTVADQGTLQGLMAYVFVAPMADFASPVVLQAPDRRAQRILRQIVSDAALVGTARASDPVAFAWGDYDAAYYLLTDDESNLKTVVLGVAVPNQDTLVIGTLSAPQTKAPAIRAALAELFGALTINDVSLSAEALNTLPQALDFP
jgi:hypothetical protein